MDFSLFWRSDRPVLGVVVVQKVKEILVDRSADSAIQNRQLSKIEWSALPLLPPPLPPHLRVVFEFDKPHLGCFLVFGHMTNVALHSALGGNHRNLDVATHKETVILERKREENVHTYHPIWFHFVVVIFLSFFSDNY